MMKVLLVGYGKMGQMIDSYLSVINGKVEAIIDKNNPLYPLNISDIEPNNIDVAIEFTHPDSGFQNVHELLSKKIPVVTGTTGWFDKIEELKKEFDPKQHTLIYGANFSVGMNLFFEIVKKATQQINATNLYDVYGLEAHHRHKADAPSGTAKVLANIVLDNFVNKNSVVYDIKDKKINDDELCFTSIRAGEIVGYHEIGFDSDFDEIKLSHNAKNRKGFAIGAILAAKFAIVNKGFHDFKDIFHLVNYEN